MSIARMIAMQIHISDTGSVIPLSNSVSGADIFALPVLNGHLTDYIALGEAFEGTARLRGIRLGALQSQSHKVADNLPELARETAASICDHTDSREINLVGFSAAGIIAFEAAKVLLEWGYEIGCLVLIDSDSTSDGNSSPVFVKFLAEWQKEISRRLRGKDNRRKRYAQLHHRAQLAEWNPTPIDVKRSIFFKAESGTIDERQLDKWRAAAKGNLNVVAIAGSHTGLREAEVAARIAQFITSRICPDRG